MIHTITAAPPRTRIAAIGAYLPEMRIASSTLEERLRERGIDVPIGFIERATGIRSRRRRAAGEQASDLAVAATQRALARAGLAPADVDLLIFASASHDVIEPATANIVQEKLGAQRARVYDVKNACNSLLSALDVADAAVHTGRARVVVVATGETPSVVTDPDSLATRGDVVRNFSHLTMGDAGGALVLVPSGDSNRGIVAGATLSQGSAWRLGTVLGFGSMYPWQQADAEHALLRSDGAALEAIARTEMPRVMRAALDAASWTPESVQLVACHQHTKRIAHQICASVGIPTGRIALPLVHSGNCASANIPLALAHAAKDGGLPTGARVLLCGGSAGFSAAAVAVVW